MKLKISPSIIGGTIAAPPSKSYTHRAIIISSLALGNSTIENFLDSDDTEYTMNACRTLGATIQITDKNLLIRGTQGRFPTQPQMPTIFVGNSGSTLRMVAPLAALSSTGAVFDGDPQLRKRPAADLLLALNNLGVPARSLNNALPPIQIDGGGIPGGRVTTSGLTSSQHISGLLMAAPYAESPVTIEITDRIHSRPYIDITMDVMRRFGVEVENHSYREFFVRNEQKYRGQRYSIEGDYSAAAYFFAAAAIIGQSVTVTNLEAESLQGDRYFLDILSRMGCLVSYQRNQVTVKRMNTLTGITVNMGDYPDIVQPMAIVAAYAAGQTNLTDISHLTHKETDRLNNTAVELRKMGISVDVTADTMTITGGKLHGAIIETYNDHRMAMSFAIAALAADGETIITGAQAVSKSYPGFYTDLAKIGVRISETV